MILLRLISWPYVRKHVLRTIMTTAGIVLGVAVFADADCTRSSTSSAKPVSPAVASSSDFPAIRSTVREKATSTL